MALVIVEGSSDAPPPLAQARAHCAALERGDLLLLPTTPIDWSPAEHAALRGEGATARAHKHVAYRLADDRLIGVRRGAADPALRAALRRYAGAISARLAALLSPYSAQWRSDYASCRLHAEQHRRLSPRTRNDRLHVDAFPSRPTAGDRILRVFTNVHPSQPRCWVTSEPFEAFIGRFVDGAAPPLPLPRRRSAWQRLRPWLAALAPPAAAPLLRRTAYDAFMLRLHDHLKADMRYQCTAPRAEWRFPPGASWVVFTDAVPHAVLSGQFALEQTFFVPRAALLEPWRAPASVLEARCRVPLTDVPSCGARCG